MQIKIVVSSLYMLWFSFVFLCFRLWKFLIQFMIMNLTKNLKFMKKKIQTKNTFKPQHRVFRGMYHKIDLFIVKNCFIFSYFHWRRCSILVDLEWPSIGCVHARVQQPPCWFSYYHANYITWFLRSKKQLEIWIVWPNS